MLFLCYPKCSTCQRAKAFLDGRGVRYDLRDIIGVSRAVGNKHAIRL